MQLFSVYWALHKGQRVCETLTFLFWWVLANRGRKECKMNNMTHASKPCSWIYIFCLCHEKKWGFIHRHNREIKNRFGTTSELLMTVIDLKWSFGSERCSLMTSQFDPVKKWNIPVQDFKLSIALTYHVIRDTLHLGKTEQNDMSRH